MPLAAAGWRCVRGRSHYENLVFGSVTVASQRINLLADAEVLETIAELGLMISRASDAMCSTAGEKRRGRA
jgi:hypothetical protein